MCIHKDKSSRYHDQQNFVISHFLAFSFISMLCFLKPELYSSTVCLTGLCLLTPLTRLKQDWINFGIIKILYIISEHSYKELEVVASGYLKNLSK